jgi:hypothetical protein
VCASPSQFLAQFWRSWGRHVLHAANDAAGGIMPVGDKSTRRLCESAPCGSCCHIPQLAVQTASARRKTGNASRRSSQTATIMWQHSESSFSPVVVLESVDKFSTTVLKCWKREQNFGVQTTKADRDRDLESGAYKPSKSAGKC